MVSNTSSPEQPFQVQYIATAIHDWVARLGAAWIEGELTAWNLRGGHAYAKLRDLDGSASLDLVVWRSVLGRLTETFAKGDRVIVNAKPDVWVKGGSLSLQAFDLRHAGLGTLLEQLEKLRRTLDKEGLFDADRKVPLPFLPRCIGLITGRDSDAEKDVRRNAELRWPAVRFRTIHTLVQGDRTVAEVCSALLELDDDPEVDVIIVARGGGDFLHLLPFSDEQLVRTAAGITTPLVSAIGHEADRPLLDEVADLRASTPTDAAKRVVPDVAEQLAIVEQLRHRIRGRISEFVLGETRALEALRSRPVLANPQRLVDIHADELLRLTARGADLIDRRVVRAEDGLAALRRQLVALSPQGTLDRGYAIVERLDTDDDHDHAPVSRHVLTAASQASAGDHLRIRLAAGRLAATVDATPSDTADIDSAQ